MMYSLTAPILYSPGFITAHCCVHRAVIRPRMTVARIQDAVARYYGLDVRYMRSAQRGRDVARPRQVAMFLAKELTPKSLPVIAREFRRDHTTIMYGIKRVEQLRRLDGELADDIDALRARLAA